VQRLGLGQQHRINVFRLGIKGGTLLLNAGI